MSTCIQLYKEININSGILTRLIFTYLYILCKLLNCQTVTWPFRENLCPMRTCSESCDEALKWSCKKHFTVVICSNTLFPPWLIMEV